MDLQKMFDDMMDAATAKRMAEQGTMTLAGLRTSLRLVPPTTIVRFAADTDNVDGSVGLYPEELESYRGYYEQLAFIPGTVPVDAATVLAMLDAAQGETFYGYKGGEFVMGAGSFLNVATNSGRCGDAVIDAAMSDGVFVIRHRDGDE